MEGVGVAHKISDSQSANHMQTIKNDKEFSKKNIIWIRDKFGETGDEETIIVPKKTTKFGSRSVCFEFIKIYLAQVKIIFCPRELSSVGRDNA